LLEDDAPVCFVLAAKTLFSTQYPAEGAFNKGNKPTLWAKNSPSRQQNIVGGFQYQPA
jgi:hypothetical protein